MFIYIYIVCIYIHIVYIYIYIYTYIHTYTIYIYTLCMYIYIYIYLYLYKGSPFTNPRVCAEWVRTAVILSSDQKTRKSTISPSLSTSAAWAGQTQGTQPCSSDSGPPGHACPISSSILPMQSQHGTPGQP